MEGLWLDQADAVAQLQGRAAGDVQLEAIGSRMIKDGFVVLPSAIAGTECDTVVSDYQRFIDDLGTEVEQHKDAGGRLLRVVNFHLSSGAAANIGCNPRLMAILDFLLGDEASVYSSLYFEHGSQQPIHRDSPFFETFPRNLFFGVWVALEDISIDAGPLMYVPGGHRFECDPHRIYDAVAACMPAAQRSALINEALEQYYGEVIRAASGVGAPVVVALKKGDVAIWHPQLPHGGSPAMDPGLTRRSMVFHCVPSSRQVYQHDVFFAHRGPAPAPRYGFTRVNGRHVALSGATAFQH
ncbi:phytanoyl-CoA dioxygenase family protein [Stenotrophomonas acidaminiphila]|uniref:phytanoyl-CoA dioxygenase family protein n=1 Tax=Stenotrophomonas acidaminiphila TaxID=128780 RepID=UPI0028A5AFAE|nr:phytanoyl-CoA dioxygenase family protein [Stenotrophomonas acidaminiphila]